MNTISINEAWLWGGFCGRFGDMLRARIWGIYYDTRTHHTDIDESEK